MMFVTFKMGYYFGALVLATIWTIASAGTSKCYSCNGPKCNDPFNSSFAIVMNCSNISAYRSSDTNEWAEEEDRIFKSFNFQSVNVDDFVCSKYVYTEYNQNMTMRRCTPRKVDSLDICDYVNKTIHRLSGKVVSCMSCDTDLCNSGIILKSSLITASILLAGFFVRLFPFL